MCLADDAAEDRLVSPPIPPADKAMLEFLLENWQILLTVLYVYTTILGYEFAFLYLGKYKARASPGLTMARSSMCAWTGTVLEPRIR